MPRLLPLLALLSPLALLTLHCGANNDLPPDAGRDASTDATAAHDASVILAPRAPRSPAKAPEVRGLRDVQRVRDGLRRVRLPRGRRGVRLDGDGLGRRRPAPACVPGMSIACAGPGACAGYQVCNAGGSAFGACVCPSMDGGASDAPVDSPTDSPSTGPAILTGAVQKGPFVLGSNVAPSPRSTRAGASTGQVFSTQTTDDLGDFSVSFAYRGNVDMQAQGFYYDEVTGALSTSPIELRALYDVTTGGPQHAYINLVTHLAHDRAVSLLAGGGMTLEAAEAQAEGELVAALGIGGAGFTLGGSRHVTLNELGGSSTTKRVPLRRERHPRPGRARAGARRRLGRRAGAGGSSTRSRRTSCRPGRSRRASPRSSRPHSRRST